MMMAATASPHNSVLASRESYTQENVCYRMEPATMHREQDELETLKQLVISPHMVSGQRHTLPLSQQVQAGSFPRHAYSPSPSPLPPPHVHSDNEEDIVLSSEQLYEQERYSPSQYLSSEDSEVEEISLSRSTPLLDLRDCGEPESPLSSSFPLQRMVSAVTSYQHVTGEGLLRGGLYGDMDGTMTTTVGAHRQVARQQAMGPSFSSSLQENRNILVSTDGESIMLGATKPVPPPRQYTPSPPHTRHNNKLKSMSSSPALLMSDQAPRARSISFLQCDAGSDVGSYPADYLGSKEIDCYTKSVNSVAKQLVNSKAVEVVTYVSSEKIRLAPPSSKALLFKSFAVKDILTVEMCSKNKRIVGVVVWKKGQLPVSHVLRCPTVLISTGLYEALLYQTQQVDEVTGSAQSPPLSETPEVDESGSNQAPSPTDLLHKVPAMYVGSAGAGKLHSVNDVIDKVLNECKPSHSRDVGVWLSLSRVRLVAVDNGQEEVVCSHDTGRIRAIGVCSRDKRYMGYIIKEEGKPLTGHVLRCTSAGLMVSLVSFLRQSCQLMVFQRGGSFYDELSADESDDFDASLEVPAQESKLVKRIRSLTMSISNRTSVTPPTPTRPSFQSHTYLRKQLSPLTNDMPLKRRNAVQNPLLVSPLDYTEEDYARYAVTYVGSASLYLPFCRDSLLDALEAFEEGGVAMGKAAVTKNSIEMQVSSFSISLTDKTHKLFVARSYGRKQILGFCVHPTDSKYFGFASPRPGFPNNMKVHVFAHGEETSSQIIDSLQYWLELPPAT